MGKMEAQLINGRIALIIPGRDEFGDLIKTEHMITADIARRLAGELLRCADDLRQESVVSFFDITERVCKNLPDGFEIQLCMENGSAWVALNDQDGRYRPLPDAADKTLIEQLNDALCVAKGFTP
jgi:hypothetical protein